MNKAFRIERAEPRSKTSCDNCETTVGPFRRDTLASEGAFRTVVLIGCKDQKGCSERRQALDNKRYPLANPE